MSTRTTALISSTLALGLAASASANKTIYNTFGPGDSYYTNDVLAEVFGYTNRYALPFNVPEVTDLYSISVALGPGDYTVYLADYASNMPTTTIDTWDVNATGGVVTLMPNATDPLAVGHYYVVVENLQGGLWFWNDIGYVGTVLIYSNQFPNEWYPEGGGTTPVMKVVDTAAPEPAPLAALGLGALGLLIRRKRSR